jgi:hypothetical protein
VIGVRALWDLADDAVSLIPHRARKHIQRALSRLAELIDPPACDSPACCWQAGHFAHVRFFRDRTRAGGEPT